MPLRAHVRGDPLGDEEHRREVDFEDGAPALLLKRQSRGAMLYARTVDQYIHASAEEGQALLHGGRDLRAVAQVAADEMHAARFAADLRGGGSALFRGAAPDDHRRAQIVIGLGDLAAEAARAAGDDGGLSFEGKCLDLHSASLPRLSASRAPSGR